MRKITLITGIVLLVGFIVLSAAALALSRLEAVSQHNQREWERQRFEKWAANLKREPGSLETYAWSVQYAPHLNAKRGIAVHTREPLRGPNGEHEGWRIDPTSKPDPTRFYVMPPGKWVHTFDEIWATWEELQHDTSRE